MLNQVQHDDIIYNVIPEICNRESPPCIKTKWLISPTKTFGDDGVRASGQTFYFIKSSLYKKPPEQSPGGFPFIQL